MVSKVLIKTQKSTSQNQKRATETKRTEGNMTDKAHEIDKARNDICI